MSFLKDHPSASERVPEPVQRFSSGNIEFDGCLGGGIPRGRQVEFYGPESSGKTTLAFTSAKTITDLGEHVLYIDFEHTFDPHYTFDILGVDPDLFHVEQPDYAEEGLQMLVEASESAEVGLVILDSVAAMVPKSELEGEVGDSTIGVVARLMSQTLRKLTGPSARTSTTVIWINQIREKIGVMFGSPETTTGGNSLKFYSSIRCDIRRKIEKDKPMDRMKIKVIKNKTAMPFQSCELTIRYEKGIDNAASLLKVASEKGIVEKKGSFYSFDGTKLGQGFDNVAQLIGDNPELAILLGEKLAG